MDERAYARYMSDVAYFITRMEQNPNSKYFMPVALAYNKMEKYDEAIEICRKAVERFPSYCPVKTMLAEAYIYKGDAADAKPLLFDVITEDPENYKALKLLGTIYKSSDETGEALKYFKAAYIRAPEDEELKRAIEELGASVSPDDLFEEYMKKNQGSLWSNPEEKSYTDIEKHIRSAEVMMTDLVADTKISDNLSSGSGSVQIPDINFISDADIDKIFESADASQPATKAPSTESANKPEPSGDKVSDDELEKLLAGANSTAKEPETIHEQVVSIQKESAAVDEILQREIENSGDYSALESILENQAANDAKEDSEAVKTSIDISDVLSALESNTENTVGDTPLEFNAQNPFEYSDSPESVPKEPSPFFNETSADDKQNEKIAVAPAEVSETANFFVLDEDSLNNQQGFDQANVADAPVTEPIPVSSDKPVSEKADENITAPITDGNLQSLDKDFDAPSDKSAEPLVEDIVSKMLEEDAAPFIVKSEKIIEDFNVISESDSGNKNIFGTAHPLDIDKTINEVEESAIKNPMDFTLEDMIGDDKEDVSISEAGSTSKDLGESVPFTQSDILDEIFSSSSKADGENFAATAEQQADIDNRKSEKQAKTMQRLLKLQSKLEKLKKG